MQKSTDWLKEVKKEIAFQKWMKRWRYKNAKKYYERLLNNLK